jgi:hypothetical protein
VIKLQRSCEFKSFDYRSNSDFGDKVCILARRNDAKVRLFTRWRQLEWWCLIGGSIAICRA